jgi:stage II sporulation protein D
MRRVLWIMSLMAVAFTSNALDVNVNLFTGFRVTSLTVQHLTGRYMIEAGGSEVTTISQGEGVSFRVADTMIEMMDRGEVISRSSTFSLNGLAMRNSLTLQTALVPVRHYDDHLLLSVQNGALRIINRIDLERYVAGVVQAEAGGSSNNIEFFMVQAMVSRTYAMRIILRNGAAHCLTDDVSNQVYKGRPVKAEILEAVARTSGQVILYDDSNLINAVFHSNSGGFTLAAEEVWVSSLPYLKPVIDTFSLGMRNSTWEHRMPAVEWLNYLEKQWGYPVHNDSLKVAALQYMQNERSRFFLHNIPLTRIRADLKFKSTYFNITTENDMVVFSGRGFGHGVGLSQEGAIRMADLGISAEEIVKFYYQGVHIRTLTDLQLLASAR